MAFTSSRSDLLCLLAPWVLALIPCAQWAMSGANGGAAILALGCAAVISTAIYVLGVRRRVAVAKIWDAVAQLTKQLEIASLPTAALDETGSAEAVSRLAAGGREVKQRMTRLAVELTNLRAAFDAAANAMLVIDSAGRVAFANRAAEGFFNRPATAMIGRMLEELFTQGEVRIAHAAALTGKIGDAQIRVQPVGGGGAGPARIIQVLASPLLLEGETARKGVLLSLRDVTELAMADKLKTDFVANASHELRTPLSSIKAAMETLADGAWDDATMRERLARMTFTNVARLEALVRDLLDLSRLESAEAPVEIHEIDVKAFAAQVVDGFEAAAAERGLSIAVEIAPGLSRVRTDPRLLELILRNLIDNATKFANQGTLVRLRVLKGEGASGGVGGVEGAGAVGGLRFEVIDRGIGIPLAQQQRIFERFFQVDSSRGGAVNSANARRGTGLGLAIVKHAVKQLGGTIGIESIWKEGTTMRVELPGCLSE